MRNDYSSEGLREFDFLDKQEAGLLFGKLDYMLKDGVHFQNTEDQFDYFNFIQENEKSINLYYQRFFGVNLEKGGEDTERYYYLDFNSQNRGSIDQDHRYFLKSEFVIIGFLIHKIIFIDGNIELTSIKKLQETIKRDYEDMKPAIYRLLAKSRKEVVSPDSDKKIDDLVEDALKEFRKIGWVKIDKDFFDVMASFQRLNNIYGDVIADIDNWINQFKEQ